MLLCNSYGHCYGTDGHHTSKMPATQAFVVSSLCIYLAIKPWSPVNGVAKTYTDDTMHYSYMIICKYPLTSKVQGANSSGNWSYTISSHTCYIDAMCHIRATGNYCIIYHFNFNWIYSWLCNISPQVWLRIPYYLRHYWTIVCGISTNRIAARRKIRINEFRSICMVNKSKLNNYSKVTTKTSIVTRFAKTQHNGAY